MRLSVLSYKCAIEQHLNVVCLTQLLPRFTVEVRVTHPGKHAQPPTACRREFEQYFSADTCLKPWTSGEDSIGKVLQLLPISEIDDGAIGR
jgi:hypothetical protein